MYAEMIRSVTVELISPCLSICTQTDALISTKLGTHVTIGPFGIFGHKIVEKTFKFGILSTYDYLLIGVENYRIRMAIKFSSHTNDVLRYQVLGKKSIKKVSKSIKFCILLHTFDIARNEIKSWKVTRHLEAREIALCSVKLVKCSCFTYYLTCNVIKVMKNA